MDGHDWECCSQTSIWLSWAPCFFRVLLLPALKKSLRPLITQKREKARIFMYKVMYSPNFIFKTYKKKGRKEARKKVREDGREKGRKEDGKEGRRKGEGDDRG